MRKVQVAKVWRQASLVCAAEAEGAVGRHLLCLRAPPPQLLLRAEKPKRSQKVLALSHLPSGVQKEGGYLDEQGGSECSYFALSRGLGLYK